MINRNKKKWVFTVVACLSFFFCFFVFQKLPLLFLFMTVSQFPEQEFLMDHSSCEDIYINDLLFTIKILNKTQRRIDCTIGRKIKKNCPFGCKTIDLYIYQFL